MTPQTASKPVGSTTPSGTRAAPGRAGISKSQAWGLAVSGSLLSATGLAMIALRYVFPTQDALSSYPHWVWPRLLMVHVFTAPVFFFYVGGVWWPHAHRHWRAHRRRVSGGALVTLVASMGVSGYALYFTGGEFTVLFWRIFHAAAGTLCTVAYVCHAAVGWRVVARASQGVAAGVGADETVTG